LSEVVDISYVGRAPVGSDAELKMSREVKVLQSRVEQLSGALQQLREKEKYQRYQVAKTPQRLPQKSKCRPHPAMPATAA